MKNPQNPVVLPPQRQSLRKDMLYVFLSVYTSCSHGGCIICMVFYTHITCKHEYAHVCC